MRKLTSSDLRTVRGGVFGPRPLRSPFGPPPANAPDWAKQLNARANEFAQSFFQD
jgi:hypothetical protein